MSRKAKIILAAAFILSLVVVGRTVFSDDGMKKYLQLRAELEALQQSTRQLEEENNRLQVTVEALKNNPRFLEKTVRDELGLIKPGEVVIKLEGDQERGGR